MPNQAQVYDVCGSKLYLCLCDTQSVKLLCRESYKPLKQFKFQIYACCYDSCLKQFLLGGRGKQRFFIDLSSSAEIEIFPETIKSQSFDIYSYKSNRIQESYNKSFKSGMECVAMLNESGDYGDWLLIHEKRDSFFDLKRNYVRVDGLDSEIKQLRAHPNFTEHQNQFFVCMSAHGEVSVKRVALFRNEYNTDLTIGEFEFGCKLLDTYPLQDTGCMITKASDFGYVYLKVREGRKACVI
jgi:hypothetical protein